MDVDAKRGVLRYLAQVPDPRARNVSHSLYNILVLMLRAIHGNRIRRLSLNLVRKLPDRRSSHTGRERKTSLKRRRLWCDWDRDYLLQALTDA